MFKKINLLNDNNGSVALIFALALPVLALGAGAAADYSAASGVLSSLQSSNDSGALEAARMFAANGGNKTGAEAAGLASLRANFEITKGLRGTLSSSQVVMTTANPPTFSATSSASVKNLFPGSASSVSASAMAQIKNKGGSTSAVEEVPTDLIIAMDVSASMGLAASIDDRNKLVAAVTTEVRKYGAASQFEKCAFACHDHAWTPTGTKTTLDLARENNVKIRFDIEKQLVLSTIDSMLKNGNKNNHRLTIFKFAEVLRLVHELSDDKSKIEKAVNLLDFESVGTFYEIVFPDLYTKISEMISNKKLRPGANKTLLIMTDGMRTKPFANDLVDIYAIKESSCNLFKNLGINIAIIELKYLPEAVTNHQNYSYISTQFPLIQPTLKTCASSPNLYGQAENAAEIIKEFNRVMKQSISAIVMTPVLIK
jgi:Flp pilus assembly protein TadG